MIDLFQEHCDYEFNARYDYVSEAYAATVLDPHHEGYSDYLMGCEQNGTEPLPFDAYMASLKVARAHPVPASKWDDNEEIPF